MNIRFFGLLLLSILIWTVACESDPKINTEANMDNVDSLATVNESPALADIGEGIQPTLKTWVDKLQIREQPYIKSKVIDRLEEGEVVEYAYETSSYMDKVELQNKTYNKPWIRIKTSDGKIGWAFGGGLRFNEDAAISGIESCADASSEDAEICQRERYLALLDRFKDYVDVGEESIVLTLENGENTMVLRNEDVENDFASYAFQNYFQEAGYYSIQVDYHEGGEYWLIHDTDGEKIPVWGQPTVSPNKQKFIVTSSDLEAGFLANGIQLWEVNEEGKLVQAWQKELKNKEPHRPIWKDDSTAVVKLLAPAWDNKNRNKTLEMTLSYRKGKWDLR